MANGGPDRGGRTIFDALRECADESDFEEFRRLQRETRGKRIVYRSTFIEGPQVEAADRRARRIHADRDRRDRLWRKFVRSLLASLTSGHLVAVGFFTRPRLSTAPELIPAFLWSDLEMDFQASSAANRTIKITLIRVYSRAEIEALAPPLPTKEANAPAAAERKCRDWIRAEARAGNPWIKADAYVEARNRIDRRLSRAAFDRAWKAAAPKSWKRPGRRRPR